MRKKILLIYSLLLFTMISANTYAQCAMCKSSVESNLKTGGSIAKGLNTGILYLMAIPYVILMLGAYFLFKKPIDEKVKAWKLKRFPKKETAN